MPSIDSIIASLSFCDLRLDRFHSPAIQGNQLLQELFSVSTNLETLSTTDNVLEAAVLDRTMSLLQ